MAFACSPTAAISRRQSATMASLVALACGAPACGTIAASALTAGTGSAAILALTSASVIDGLAGTGSARVCDSICTGSGRVGSGEGAWTSASATGFLTSGAACSSARNASTSAAGASLGDGSRSWRSSSASPGCLRPVSLSSMILLMEASISSMEGSRCALLAVAIVTSAALVTSVVFRRRHQPDSNHGDSVTDGSPHENPQSGDMWDFNRLEREAEVSKNRVLRGHETSNRRPSGRPGCAGRSTCP